MAVGDSTDGTREAIEKLGSDKIRIVDTACEKSMRISEQIFAQQANIVITIYCNSIGLTLSAQKPSPSFVDSIKFIPTVF